MKMSFKGLSLILLSLISFTACEEPTDNGYTVPSTYNFKNVSYTGQQNRLDKMAEITTYIKTAHTANASALDAAKLKDMYGANTGGHFSTTDLNTSTKQLKNKTISTDTSAFKSYMDAVALASQSTNMTASNGQAGIAAANDGSTYLFNERGIEFAQIIEKGLMGACFYYQATAVYMGASKMDVNNSEPVDAANDKNYTAMEHHWDEAFGYFGVPIDFPSTTSTAVFWGKYCNKHESEYPLNKKMMDGFLKGRAAITAKDMTTRDAQITSLRKNFELVVAATAIYYLNNAKRNLATNTNKAYHELSEALGFIMSLKYGANQGISEMHVNSILTDLFGNSDPLQANNYNVTETKIETAKTELVSHITALASVKDSL